MMGGRVVQKRSPPPLPGLHYVKDPEIVPLSVFYGVYTATFLRHPPSRLTLSRAVYRSADNGRWVIRDVWGGEESVGRSIGGERDGVE